MGTFLGDPCKNGHIGRRYAGNHACIECSKIYGKNWKANHAEREAERKRQWKRDHAEIVKEQKRRAYDPIRKVTKERRDEALKQRTAKQFVYALIKMSGEIAKNEERKISDLKRPLRLKTANRQSSSKRRARRKNAEGKFTVDQALLIREWQGDCCAYCESTENLCIDHMQPLSRKGSNHPSNIQWLCKPCNDSKGTKPDSELRKIYGQKNPAADYIRMLFKIMGL